MKKSILSIAALCVAAFAMTSCDDFLTEDLKGDYNSSNIFSTETYARQAVNGIYNASRYSINLWKFGDIASDDAVKGGKPGDQASLDEVNVLNVKNDNGALKEFWQNTYETISRANNVIDGVSGKAFESGDQLTAEAQFLRAYSYFQLVNIFGEVPLKLLPQDREENIFIGLSSVAEVYAQIEADLKAAAAVLPVQYDVTNVGRATRGAALGLLAKAQLYQQKYSDALTSINALKALGVYSLDSYENLFRLGNEASPEAIWTIRFLSTQVPAMGNSLNQWFAPQPGENGYYFNNPTENWVKSFTEKQENGEEDLRIDLSIGRAGHEWFEQGMFNPAWSNTGYLVKKHNQPLSEVEAGKKGDGGLGYIYLRYADVLLMEAECYVELNQPAQGKPALDAVRTRAGLAPIAASVAANQSQMRQAVRLERRHELAFEFHRFFDLMRWGKDAAESALATKEGVNYKWGATRYYFPLPQTELDANPAIK